MYHIEATICADEVLVLETEMEMETEMETEMERGAAITAMDSMREVLALTCKHKGMVAVGLRRLIEVLQPRSTYQPENM